MPPPSLWAAAVSDGQVIDFQGAAWVRLEHPVIVVAVDGDARRYRRMVRVMLEIAGSAFDKPIAPVTAIVIV